MNKDYLKSKAYTYINQMSPDKLQDPFLYKKEQDMLIIGYKQHWANDDEILIPNVKDFYQDITKDSNLLDSTLFTHHLHKCIKAIAQQTYDIQDIDMEHLQKAEQNHPSIRSLAEKIINDEKNWMKNGESEYDFQEHMEELILEIRDEFLHVLSDACENLPVTVMIDSYKDIHIIDPYDYDRYFNIRTAGDWQLDIDFIKNIDSVEIPDFESRSLGRVSYGNYIYELETAANKDFINIRCYKPEGCNELEIKNHQLLPDSIDTEHFPLGNHSMISSIKIAFPDEIKGDDFSFKDYITKNLLDHNFIKEEKVYDYIDFSVNELSYQQQLDKAYNNFIKKIIKQDKLQPDTVEMLKYYYFNYLHNQESLAVSYNVILKMAWDGLSDSRIKLLFPSHQQEQISKLLKSPKFTELKAIVKKYPTASPEAAAAIKVFK